jgi:pimeloyl-ACP methyl ester carboxylesterase
MPVYSERFFRSGPMRIHLRDWGHTGAPPLIIVHGLRDHSHSFDDLAHALVDRFHITAGSPADWFWPTWCCFWTALLAVLIRVPDRIDKMTGKQLAIFRDLRLSEPQEFYFALLLAIYLLSVRARLARSQCPEPGIR